MTLITLFIICGIHLAIAGPLIANLLQQRFEPGAMLAWLLIILLLPFIGALTYARLGENRVLIRAQRKRGTCSHPDLPKGDWVEETATLGRFRSAAEAGNKLAGAFVTRGNKLEIYEEPDAIQRAWKDAINAAKSTIHMEYYIWWPDKAGTEMRDLIVARANEGLRCRLLIDAVGSMKLKQEFLQAFYDAGVQVAFFLPLATWKRRWSPHLRNHRKILVVDGTVGFIGSQNISDDAHGGNPRFPHWHNVHLRLEGPAVSHLQSTFLDDWYFASEETPASTPSPPPVTAEGSQTLQILPTGPDCKKHILERVLLEAFNNAETSIDIATPYFVPSPVLRMALLQAALRGVKVRIVIPAATDQAIALYAGRSFYAELLEEGIEIHEYREGMIHSKLIAVDDTWTMVGSANMDYRSLRLNFEISALIYDPNTATSIRRIVEGYCDDAVRILEEHLAKKRTYRHLLEGAARVLSPQL